MTKVIIGIPVYNEEVFLARTIESALNQDYKDVEIVISDNCSTDNSLKIAKDYASKNNNVKVISPSENVGAIGNFIFLLNAIDAEYFMWLGAHDTITENYISNSISILDSDENLEMVFHRSRYIDENDEPLKITMDGSNIANHDVSDYSRISNVFDLIISTVIHGVFRTENLKRIPSNNEIRFDLQILFFTSTYGKIYRVNDVGFYRRKMRNEETFEARKKRLASYKMYFNKSILQYDMINIRIGELSYLSFFEKFKLRVKFFKRFYHFLSLSDKKFTNKFIGNSSNKSWYRFSYFFAMVFKKMKDILRPIKR